MGVRGSRSGRVANRIDFNGWTAKLGRALVSFAAETFFDVESFSAAEGTVNEQNMQAVGFYEEDGVRGVQQSADGQAALTTAEMCSKRMSAP